MTVDRILAVFRFITFLLERAEKNQAAKAEKAGVAADALLKVKQKARDESVRAATTRAKFDALLG